MQLLIGMLKIFKKNEVNEIDVLGYRDINKECIFKAQGYQTFYYILS